MVGFWRVSALLDGWVCKEFDDLYPMHDFFLFASLLYDTPETKSPEHGETQQKHLHTPLPHNSNNLERACWYP